MENIKEAPITVGSGKNLIKKSPFQMEGGTPLELALRDNYEAQRQLSKIIDEGVEIIKKERDEEIIDILDKAEELIRILDEEEKDKNLMTLYRYIHSHNVSHSCYKVHQDWRDEFKYLNNNPN